MALSLQNKIVTRGFGVARSVPGTSGPVTMGYGPLAPGAVVTAIERPLRLRQGGQSGTKRRLQELDEVIVWAKMVEANGIEPMRPIKGWVRVRVNRNSGYASVMAENLAVRVRKAWETVKVSVQRLK